MEEKYGSMADERKTFLNFVQIYVGKRHSGSKKSI